MELSLICPGFCSPQQTLSLSVYLYNTMGLVSVRDPKYYSSTNTESPNMHKFPLRYQDHLSLICLVSDGHFKKCGRSMCENSGAFR